VQAPVTVVQSTSISEGTDWNRHRINDKASSRWLDAWSKHPGADIIKISDAGHYTMLEQPDLVTEAIRAAFARRQSQL
jgi:pimeloyl-ACP methyl ester carboxylesterase